MEDGGQRILIRHRNARAFRPSPYISLYKAKTAGRKLNFYINHNIPKEFNISVCLSVKN